MSTDYQKALVSILSRLDQLSTEANAILAEPGDVEIGARAEELRELVVEMQATVEGKLDQLEVGVAVGVDENKCQAECPECRGQCKLYPRHAGKPHVCSNCGNEWTI